MTAPFTMTDADLAQSAQERQERDRRMRREEDYTRYVEAMAMDEEGDEDGEN